MVFLFEDDGFARLSRLRVRGNENTILGMGFHGTPSTRKGTPRYVRNRLQGKPVASHVFNAPRAGQTWFPRNPTRPL